MSKPFIALFIFIDIILLAICIRIASAGYKEKP